MPYSWLKNDWSVDVGLAIVDGFKPVHKYGRNPNLPNAVGTFEAIWQGGGFYTGFNCTVASTLEVTSTSTTDKGTLLCSGNVTNVSIDRLIDDNATFISDGVTKGDLILLDDNDTHAVIREVIGETDLRIWFFDKFGTVRNAPPSIGDSYRIATTASTGAAVVHLQLMLDKDLRNETSEFLIMDGTTVVTTQGEYMRQSRGEVLLTGSNLVAASDITCKQSINASNIMMVMPQGYNKSMICAYTIPMDVQLAVMPTLFTSISGKVGGNSNVRFHIRHVGEVFQVFEEFTISLSGSSWIQREYKFPKNNMSPGSDIYLGADSDTNNVAVSGGIDLLIKQ
jgi:hypothetical protein